MSAVQRWMNDPTVSLIMVAAVVVVALVIYFLPTFVAYIPQHERRGSILLVNLFLGVTFIGRWFALIWARKARDGQARIRAADVARLVYGQRIVL